MLNWASWFVLEKFMVADVGEWMNRNSSLLRILTITESKINIKNSFQT